MTIRSRDSTRALVAESEGWMMMIIIDRKSMAEGETHRTGRGGSFLAEAPTVTDRGWSNREPTITPS